MQSILELYRIGVGPSSSHTMGPEKALRAFRQKYPHADAFQAVLMGSLAKTGEGHGTDKVLISVASPLPCKIVWDFETQNLPHPNTMDLFAYKNGEEIGRWQVQSIGGGSIHAEGMEEMTPPDIYPGDTFAELAQICRDNGLRLWELAERVEGAQLWTQLTEVWHTMREAIARGLAADGELDGGLHIQRKARYLFNQRHMDESPQTRENRLVCAYAYAVSEENASRGRIVTAPTCGSCGVLPAVLRYAQESRRFSDEEILRALATAGIIGNIIRTNASISGAECGCQAEIGSACSMAAAALAELYGMELDQVEYAAEVAMEHHLGLTCDPIKGLVQIPCIERNAVAAMRAMQSVSLANFLTYTRKISFDMVVETMYRTGKDLSTLYRETAEGGLAKLYKQETE